jgi:hypothetical protein
MERRAIAGSQRFKEIAKWLHQIRGEGPEFQGCSVGKA